MTTTSARSPDQESPTAAKLPSDDHHPSVRRLLVAEAGIRWAGSGAGIRTLNLAVNSISNVTHPCPPSSHPYSTTSARHPLHVPTATRGQARSRQVAVTGKPRRGTHRSGPPPPSEARERRVRKPPMWWTRSHAQGTP